MRIWTLVFPVLFAACGAPVNDGEDSAAEEKAEEEEATDDHPSDEAFRSAMILLQGEELPACGESNDGALVYQEGAGFSYCKSGSWKAIDLTGPKGEKGDTGEAGVAGAQGEKGDQGDPGVAGQDGTSGKIAIAISCSRFLDNTVVKAAANGDEAVDLGATPIDFSTIAVTHDVTIMENGDTYVVATFWDSWKDTKVDFYANGTNGATNALVYYFYDYAFAVDGGYFEYSMTSTDFIVEYTDVAPDDAYANFGSNSRTVSWTKPLTECNVTTY